MMATGQHLWNLMELAGMFIGGTIGFLVIIRLIPERWVGVK